MGTRCGNCGQDTLEGKPDEKTGMWKYRCQYCVDHEDPNAPNPCPECGCTAHENICYSGPQTAEGFKGAEKAINNPVRPDVERFRCLNCAYEWYTPEYEQYLYTRVMVEVIKKE
jgi:hypothetical protein